MSAFSHYRINVAVAVGTAYGGGIRYSHLFATAPESLRDRDPAFKVLAVMKAKFPEAEGYSVTMTRWEVVGHEVLA